MQSNAQLSHHQSQSSVAREEVLAVLRSDFGEDDVDRLGNEVVTRILKSTLRDREAALSALAAAKERSHTSGIGEGLSIDSSVSKATLRKFARANALLREKCDRLAASVTHSGATADDFVAEDQDADSLKAGLEDLRATAFASLSDVQTFSDHCARLRNAGKSIDCTDELCVSFLSAVPVLLKTFWLAIAGAPFAGSCPGLPL